MDVVVASDFDTTGPRIDNAIRALIDVGQLYDAIELLQQVLIAKPQEAKYRRLLVGFLGETQLVNEQDLHLEQLICERQFDVSMLIATTETST